MEKDSAKPLRHGYTTGSCATAASKAALWSLIQQERLTEVTIRIPIGEEVRFTLQSCEFTQEKAAVSVIKDGGDDPDATHGALIVVEVSWLQEAGIRIDGGTGVGRVTKPGLPVEIGEAAINPVPRKMIKEAVQSVLDQSELNRGVLVMVSVPDGEEIAKKTLNGRLGIIGGISILGTRGTVVPFSSAAYKASVAQAIRVAVRCGCNHLVLSTGGRTETFGMSLYPGLPEEAFIEMGDFVGFALTHCKKQGVRKVTLVGMMGKFSKVAQGVMMVHSKSAPVDFGFLANMAADSGASEEWVTEIQGANTATQVGELMATQGNHNFFNLMCQNCCEESLKQMSGGVDVETVIISMKAELWGRAEILQEL